MKCETKFCRNAAANGRHFCPKCRSRQFKEAHPLKYSFNLLRSGAKRRGKVFTVTFEEYEKLAKETGYDVGKGKSADCLSIDRIDNSKGYEPGNLRVITISENVKKQRRLEFVGIPEWMKDEIRAANSAPENPF